MGVVWFDRVNTLKKVVTLISSPFFFLGHAIASDIVCPDIPNAAYSVVPDPSSRIDFWIIPDNTTGTIDTNRTYSNLISGYLKTTKPLFSCFGNQKYPEGNSYARRIYCYTADGRSFGGNDWPTIIPDKSGGFQEVEIYHRWAGYTRVSCKSRITESYQLIQFKVDRPGAPIPMPYFIISGGRNKIEVRDNQLPRF
jgi:hypothetical protein